jgi:hypothetical protein
MAAVGELHTVICVVGSAHHQVSHWWAIPLPVNFFRGLCDSPQYTGIALVNLQKSYLVLLNLNSTLQPGSQNVWEDRQVFSTTQTYTA